MVVWIGFFVAFVWCAAVLADDNPGDRAFTALGGGRLGQSASVGATGNLGLSLPLQLPSPRGALPLPLVVSYNKPRQHILSTSAELMDLVPRFKVLVPLL
jgi:hypothetical protein